MTEREKFIGVWELEGIQDFLGRGEEEEEEDFFEGEEGREKRRGRKGPIRAAPAGFEKPVGLLIYLASGVMSVNFSGSSRIPFLREFSPSPSELSAAGAAYGGYAGRWELEKEAPVVVHMPVVSFVPNRVGARVRRSYSFKENLLILRPIALAPHDEAPNRVLIWRRQTPR